MLDWFPESDDYPGACVCVHCSRAIMVLKGSVRDGVSLTGHEGLIGTLRVHNEARQS